MTRSRTSSAGVACERQDRNVARVIRGAAGEPETVEYNA
jgi:hypothetical protein